MATLEKFQQSTRSRRLRYFSEEFRKQKVRDIERNLCSVGEVCREYEVSRTAVYNWIYKYSVHRKKGIKQVVELKSDTRKLQAFRKRLSELERVIGEKQILIEHQSKIIRLVEQAYRIDVTRQFGEALSACGIPEEVQVHKKRR